MAQKKVLPDLELSLKVFLYGLEGTLQKKFQCFEQETANIYYDDLS